MIAHARHFVLAALAAVSILTSLDFCAAADRAFGEYLSSECVTCHQLSGRFEGIPSIVGWPEASFIAIMKQYRMKERANPVMQNIAAKLSEEEIAALATYFGSITSQPHGK